MTFRHIEYTVEVAKAGSISKAARTLMVSQPYLSGMLNSLEKELGYPLFLRKANGVELTEEGSRFIEHARRIVNDIEQIYEIQPNKEIPLKIASYFSKYLSEKFIYFLDKNPENTQDRMWEMGNMAVIETVSQGKCTMGLIYCAISKIGKFTDIAEKNGLDIDPLPVELKPFAVMNNLHESAWKQVFTPEDFLNNRYVSHDDESTKLYLQEHLGMGKKAPFIETKDRASFSDALRTGKYISLIHLPENVTDSEFVIRPLMNLGKLEEEINVRVSVLRQKDYKFTKRERDFIKFISE